MSRVSGRSIGRWADEDCIDADILLSFKLEGHDVSGDRGCSDFSGWREHRTLASIVRSFGFGLLDILVALTGGLLNKIVTGVKIHMEK